MQAGSGSDCSPCTCTQYTLLEALVSALLGGIEGGGEARLKKGGWISEPLADSEGYRDPPSLSMQGSSPFAGFNDNSIAALQKANLTSMLKSVAGVNTQYDDPIGADQITWNKALDNALHAMEHSSIPDGHIMPWNRVSLRRETFCYTCA